MAVVVVVLALTAHESAAGQPPSGADSRVSFSVLGGASTGSGDAGAAVGATVLFDVSSRLSIEARSVYLDRGPGASALDLNASLLVSLLDGRKVNPYLAVGGGVYRAMFDLGNQRVFGMMGAGVPNGSQLVALPNGQGWGAMPGPGMMGWTSGQNFGPGWMMGNGFNWNSTTQAGPTFSGTQMPMFYAQRMGAVSVPSGGWHMQSFTDPALSFGGGVRFDLTRAVYVRPDVRVLTVFGSGDVSTISGVTFSMGYRF
jgi:hypothetical protein